MVAELATIVSCSEMQVSDKPFIHSGGRHSMSDNGPLKCLLCMTIIPMLADLDQHSRLGLVISISLVPLRDSQRHQQETDDTVIDGASYGNAIAVPWHTL